MKWIRHTLLATAAALTLGTLTSPAALAQGIKPRLIRFGYGLAENTNQGLSNDEQKVLMDAAVASRSFERKDTRESSTNALAELRAKGMEFSSFSPKEAVRLRDKLTKVNASIAANVGMDLWNEAQAELAKMRK
jgi:hypothetical protein